MAGKDAFERRKRQLIAENERAYGAEIRAKYGDQAVRDSEARLMGQSEAQHARAQALSEDILRLLAEAVAAGDPAGPVARLLCEAHREWLTYYLPAYSKPLHLGLGRMYAEDARFAAYYDQAVAGGAAFLRDALNAFLS